MISCRFMSWKSNPFVAFNRIYRTFYCRMLALMGNSRNRNKYRIKDCTLDFLLLNLVFINKQLYYVHSCHSHVLTVVPDCLDARNGGNPGTIARRKAPVIPISVMPLRKNKKVYPVICAQIRLHAAARKMQDIWYVCCIMRTAPHFPWENGGTPSCQM